MSDYEEAKNKIKEILEIIEEMDENENTYQEKLKSKKD